MLNKKSFDLNNEEKNTNKSETLYQPKKFRWCKCIVLPLLAGFMLLLILANVDFTGDAYKPTWLEIQSKIINDQLQFQTRDKLECIISTDSCSVTCTAGNTNNMYKILEPPYEKCAKDMGLILKDCEFPAGKLKSDFFEGNFRLKEVNITNCNLNAVDDTAFKHDSVKHLKNLYMTNTQFTIMEKSTFDGLEELERFHLINQQTSWSNFRGVGFLDAFSKTLKSLLITQMTTNDIAYDPNNWINGSNMSTLLSLDLSNNNFQQVLNNKTFSTLLAIEVLILANCNISYLPTNIFDNNLSTLKHIDLNGNHLTVLPGDMLLKMNGLKLNLNNNNWDCVCANMEMFKIIQNEKVNITYVQKEEFQCYTPKEKLGMEVHKLALEECLRKTTLAETTDMKTTVDEDKISSISTESSSETDTTEIETNETSEETSESHEISTTTTTSHTSSITKTEISTLTTPWNTTNVNSTTENPKTTKTSTTTSAATTKTTSNLVPPEEISTSTMFTSTTTTYPLYPIECLNTKGNPIDRYLKQNTQQFSLYPISATSVQMIFSKILDNVSVLYYTNFRTLHHQQIIENISIRINNLDPNNDYVFCLIKTINKNISPFDCKSYSRPEIIPQPWLLKEDVTWIICLVVLGICLMLLLGIILFISAKHLKRRHSKKHLNKSSDTQLSSNINQYISDIPLTNFRDSQKSSDTLYHSQHQPPDIIASQPNRNMYDDLDLYEDLVM